MRVRVSESLLRENARLVAGQHERDERETRRQRSHQDGSEWMGARSSSNTANRTRLQRRGCGDPKDGV